MDCGDGKGRYWRDERGELSAAAIEVGEADNQYKEEGPQCIGTRGIGGDGTPTSTTRERHYGLYFWFRWIVDLFGDFGHWLASILRRFFCVGWLFL
tara:strand:+ start:2489 stop:2776 length:288 start_codon:yes stop_codon:yes gene_type:complete